MVIRHEIKIYDFGFTGVWIYLNDFNVLFFWADQKTNCLVIHSYLLISYDYRFYNQEDKQKIYLMLKYFDEIWEYINRIEDL